jgi:uncharacterized protein
MDTLPIWTNLTLIVPVSVMLGVQIYKFIWELARHRRMDWQVLFRTGGMPSSHSALVTSLATATGIQYGFESGLFAVTTVLALIVMYDARGVRQESGQHARVLNHIVRELFSGHAISERELKELLGHTTIEVFVGALVGIVYTILLVPPWRY